MSLFNNKYRKPIFYLSNLNKTFKIIYVSLFCFNILSLLFIFDFLELERIYVYLLAFSVTALVLLTIIKIKWFFSFFYIKRNKVYSSNLQDTYIEYERADNVNISFYKDKLHNEKYAAYGYGYSNYLVLKREFWILGKEETDLFRIHYDNLKIDLNYEVGKKIKSIQLSKKINNFT
jgi:hypothetical protein